MLASKEETSNKALDVGRPLLWGKVVCFELAVEPVGDFAIGISHTSFLVTGVLANPSG